MTSVCDREKRKFHEMTMSNKHASRAIVHQMNGLRAAVRKTTTIMMRDMPTISGPSMDYDSFAEFVGLRDSFITKFENLLCDSVAANKEDWQEGCAEVIVQSLSQREYFHAAQAEFMDKMLPEMRKLTKGTSDWGEEILSFIVKTIGMHYAQMYRTVKNNEDEERHGDILKLIGDFIFSEIEHEIELPLVHMRFVLAGSPTNSMMLMWPTQKWEESRPILVAVAMSRHRRLGSASPLHLLDDLVFSLVVDKFQEEYAESPERVDPYLIMK